MKQSRLLFSDAICLILCLAGCSKGRTHEVSATVLMVHGTASVSHGKNSFDPLQRGHLLTALKSVRVSSGSDLDAAVLPGFLLHVEGDSEFTMEQLTLTKDGNETQGGMVNRVAHIRIGRGSAIVSTKLPQQEPGQFIATTDHVTITADSDTLLQIDTAAEATRVLCVRGKAATKTAEGLTSVLSAGSFQTWGTGSTEPSNTESDLVARGESDQANKIESALLDIDPPESFHLR